MPDLGLANITMFFVIIGICVIFTVTWIIKSEARINVCKDEIKRLKTSADNAEREKFVLSEKIANLESAGPGAGNPELESQLRDTIDKNDTLKEENKKLKKELAEAKASLAEVYKALS